MKPTITRYFLITLLSATLPSVAKTGANSSNLQTDVNAPDSTAMYAEELQRTQLINDSKVIFINGDPVDRADDDSVKSMLAKFYIDQFRNSQDPETPYFTFISKDANLAMGIGGKLALNGWYDWNGIVDGMDFNTYLIPVPKTPETMRQLDATAAGSAIFFNLMGRHTPIGDYRVYIEGGFTGYGNRGFKLKKAWFEIRDFTLGLTKSTFSDPAAQPGVLDPAGANGRVEKNNVLIRYMHTWRNHWTVAGSVEYPSSHPSEQENVTEKLPDYVPDIAAFGQFQWNRGMSHVRLAGIFRSMAYRDLVENRNRHSIGWGVQLSSVVRVGRILTLYALGSVGQGIASYTGDLSSGDYDLLANPDHSGELYAPNTVSATAGAKVQITPKLSSTVCLSTLRHFTKDNPNDDTYKYGQYFALNVAYDITSRIQAGLEYLAGKRKNCSGEAGNANRGLASLTFSF